MNNDEFRAIVNKQLTECRKTLSTKEKIYSEEGRDRLIQFYTASAVTGRTPIQSLMGMLIKHTILLYDLSERESCEKDLWIEAITDHINYLLLLRALIEEEM